MTCNDLLAKALDVFILYGFRKTSMDDVARAVGVSRQALYNRFKNKRALFKAVVDDAMHQSFSAARSSIKDSSIPIRKRLLKAFDCAAGQYVDALRSSPHSHEVIAMVNTEGGDEVERQQRHFNTQSAQILVNEGVFADKRKAEDAMFTLFTASRGLLYSAENRQAYSDGLQIAIRTVIPDRAT